MSPASTEQFLLEQYIGHPASQLQDLRKALYQSVFGCGHLITDTSAAAEGIRRETAEAGPCSREIEALDGPWSRVHLGVLADGLTPETLSLHVCPVCRYVPRGCGCLAGKADGPAAAVPLRRSALFPGRGRWRAG